MKMLSYCIIRQYGIRKIITKPGHSRGNALLNLQKYPEAITSYQQAIKYKPDYQQAIEALKQAENQLPQPKNRPIIVPIVPTVGMPNANY